MAKAANSRAFRKVDVDHLTEQPDDDQEDGVEDSGPSEQEVKQFLARGDLLQALRHVLSRAPRKSKNPAVKAAARDLTFQVMSQVKSADMQKHVQSLSDDEVDMLMKYIYKGFEGNSYINSSQLLQWHEKVFSRGGHGCILRVMTDRQGV